MIHENNSLSGVQKLHYLKSCLKDGAAAAIAALPTTDNNYAIAWDIIHKRYENNKILVKTHVENILDLPCIVKESATALRTLLDSLLRNVRALQSLNEATDEWGTILIHIVCRKLDGSSRRAWEMRDLSTNIPTFWELETFLRERAQLLETMENGQKRDVSQSARPPVNRVKAFTTTQPLCPDCGKEHKIYYCEKFAARNHEQRLSRVKQLRLCLNCLGEGHTVQNCRSDGCRRCRGRHHTQLHRTTSFESTTRNNNNSVTQRTQDTENATVSSLFVTDSQKVLLSTALVSVPAADGTMVTVRALLDSGSQASFITKALQQRLNCNTYPSNTTVVGISGTSSLVTTSANLNVCSQYNSYKFSISCFILPTISNYIPTLELDQQHLRIPANIKLADSTFYKPGNIDMLLGADVFYRLLSDGRIHLGPGMPTLQKTALGWVIAGVFQNSNISTTLNCYHVRTATLDDQLTRFWAVEDLADCVASTSIDTVVDELFVKTTTRTEDGRFVVSIPLCEDVDVLGESYTAAYKRLRSMERKFEKDPQLKLNYSTFMSDYTQQNHMKLVTTSDQENAIYLPHHAVLNESSLTTKLRVVFDASSATSNGKSFNDIQHCGPQLQTDIVNIILRFRMHRYVITADVTQMYRQILITPEQCKMQRILWREAPSERVQIYELKTLTYGMKSSPYLAIRCIHMLADIHASEKPTASAIMKSDFYMDDLITGADTIPELLQIRNDVDAVMGSAGFSLRKWSSNSRDVLRDCGTNNKTFAINIESTQKTLGILWLPTEDRLRCVVRMPKMERVTKRKILGATAQIFDPLGFLAPVTVIAKMILQTLWANKVPWDTLVPNEIRDKWFELCQQWGTLNTYSIPRRALAGNILEIHCFADASEKAYGACIYVKSIDDHGKPVVNLLISRSKVAPLKAMTVPKLELSASSLLVDLYRKVKTALTLTDVPTYFWSDSMIVLGWIRSDPCRWKTFVRNRVTKIQDITSPTAWCHVPTQSNPADMISRGMMPNDLTLNDLWWSGPEWLLRSRDSWPTEISTGAVLPEGREQASCLIVTASRVDFALIDRYSSLLKLIRVTAICFRFVHNMKHKSDRQLGPLQATELDNALLALVRLVQRATFEKDIRALSKNNVVDSSSNLRRLSPFIAVDGFLRVGGRIQHAKLPFNATHPMILPEKGHFTELIVGHYHKKYLHAGANAIHSAIRERFWIISGRNVVRRVLGRCIICFRAKPQTMTQLMGSLPAERTQPSLPFSITGVDFGGPMKIVESHRRGNNKLIKKCYIAVFVCYVTRAVHLDVVSDLTSEAFIACLRRFIARRGTCREIHSDNATNFVGAQNELQRLIRSSLHNIGESLLTSYLATAGVTWKFIPPRSPHHGGIWEAAVRSVKYHLVRTVGDALFTFEEYQTLLTQVESCLNSRPLCPMSSDPHDLNAITPFHFLVGSLPTILPEPSFPERSGNYISRWHQLQQLRQTIWKRWSREYLHTLQQRNKWQSSYPNLQCNDLVLIVDDLTPPLRWPLARVVKVHPGSDSKVRVVTVRSASGEFKRAITKLCKVPINND